ncbi:hypothetical protein B0H10DRAFT_1941706 [Mycena sp. CBHHK59/15]|nr:hypothetical protein B0H10DRAFT_1941706 [Mycena sp. CBHHK59/15]
MSTTAEPKPPLLSLPSTPGPQLPGSYPRNSVVFQDNHYAAQGTSGAGLFAAAKNLIPAKLIPPAVASYFPTQHPASENTATSNDSSAPSTPGQGHAFNTDELHRDGSVTSNFSTHSYAGSGSSRSRDTLTPMGASMSRTPTGAFTLGAGSEAATSHSQPASAPDTEEKSLPPPPGLNLEPVAPVPASAEPMQPAPAVPAPTSTSTSTPAPPPMTSADTPPPSSAKAADAPPRRSVTFLRSLRRRPRGSATDNATTVRGASLDTPASPTLTSARSGSASTPPSSISSAPSAFAKPASAFAPSAGETTPPGQGTTPPDHDTNTNTQTATAAKHKPSLLRTLRGEAAVLSGRMRRDPARVERGRQMMGGAD